MRGDIYCITRILKKCVDINNFASIPIIFWAVITRKQCHHGLCAESLARQEKMASLNLKVEHFSKNNINDVTTPV